MEREPDVSIDVYVKRQPLLEGLLSCSVRSFSEQSNTHYRWQPFATVLPLITLDVSLQPHPYCLQIFLDIEEDGYLEEILLDAKTEGLTIPLFFLEKLSGHDGALVANQEMYAFLQRSPDIQKLLSEYPFFWEVLAFAHGEPLYRVTVEVCDDALKRGIPFALQFARYLQRTYQGIACDDTETRYGKPFQLGEDARLATRLLPQELAEIRWDWSAAK